jgi:uncharacterized membrane protein
MHVVHTIMEWLAVVIDLTGSLVMVWAFIASVVSVVGSAFRRSNVRNRFHDLQVARCELGTKLVFALELMIVSDLLQTIISRSIDDLIFLGGLVVIRTTIAYFLNKEIQEVHAELVLPDNTSKLNIETTD